MFSYLANKNFVRFMLVNLAIFTGLFFAFFFKLKSLILFLVIIFASLALVTFYYRKTVYLPLKLISRQVAAVIAGNKYEKVKVPTKDEFGLIAHFFNEVTDNLESISFELKEGERMASELTLASDIQASVLPVSIPVVPGLDTVAKTRPADEVGGDSFSIVQKGNEYYIYIGDVTGHGAPAGLIMMMVSTLFDVMLPLTKNTKDLAVSINKVLKPRVNSSMFMTTAFFRWDTQSRKLFYTGAGHEHILIYRAAEGVCEAIPTGGIALAMAEDISEIVSEKELVLHEQDMIVMYSDGITEAVNSAGELYGLERLKTAVKQYGHLGNSLGLFEALSLDVTSFTGDTVQKDDMTLIVMRYSNNDVVSESENLVSTNWTTIEPKA
jgi:sigma-B regulation protein RsbU (phosphoserine phosphatase)